MFMNFHSLPRVNLLHIFIINQNNKLKTSSQVNISVFSHCRKRGQKGHLSLFFQNVTLSILMIYFISCLQMEIKYMCSLNNAQHIRL
uniref:Uncharacterized protein n=1 Tax=Saimiri boliviensis boliviensis TaxID=39432 RepID=A0A2K6UUY3_SAIBB